MNKNVFYCLTVIGLFLVNFVFGQTYNYNGLDVNIGNIYRLSNAKTRSISAENYTGEKGKGGMAIKGTGEGAARDLGQTWKINPCITIKADTTVTIADIDGSGAIQQMWFTPNSPWRYLIFRIYWDNEKSPSVETPIGDLFCMGWGEYKQITSLPVCVNPGSAFNSYWVMPFRKHCKITVQNISGNPMTLFYQINYTLTDIPEDAAYFHAQFRRTNPLPYKSVYTILDNIKGKGQYVGTYLAWQTNNSGWWGEGEIKFFMDGDTQFPTICGTGTEDYFCGSYDFDSQNEKGETNYTDFSTSYSGFFVNRPDGHYKAQTRFTMYRWHIQDPVRFDKDLKVTIQALGWRSGGRYLPLQDDISSVGVWYQTEPHNAFPKFPTKDELEVK